MCGFSTAHSTALTDDVSLKRNLVHKKSNCPKRKLLQTKKKPANRIPEDLSSLEGNTLITIETAVVLDVCWSDKILPQDEIPSTLF
jgi:16S rRNA U516 pseudouridylate synthase RsuA-like enzyme